MLFYTCEFFENYLSIHWFLNKCCSSKYPVVFCWLTEGGAAIKFISIARNRVGLLKFCILVDGMMHHTFHYFGNFRCISRFSNKFLSKAVVLGSLELCGMWASTVSLGNSGESKPKSQSSWWLMLGLQSSNIQMIASSVLLYTQSRICRETFCLHFKVTCCQTVQSCLKVSH